MSTVYVGVYICLGRVVVLVETVVNRDIRDNGECGERRREYRIRSGLC